MTAKDMRRAERKYLEECATACPHCGEVAHWRDMDNLRVRNYKDARPEIVVPCHCRACAGGWDEYFGLTDVTLMIKRGSPR